MLLEEDFERDETVQIRHTRLEDLDKIMKIYEYARAFMAETGNPNQWGPTNWPPEEVIREDISLDRSYVCVDEEDQVVGTFCYIYGQDIDETYRVIEDGAWAMDAAYGVVHRMASDGTKGVGSFCLNWAFEQSGYLRIDTHPDNKVMQGLLAKLGFTKRGIIHVVEDNYPRYAYDLML